jgi:L-alanine-DL-glutamate epimerase-like enolase superfamily enzyme
MSSQEFGEHLLHSQRLLVRLTDEDGFQGWGESSFDGSRTVVDAALGGLVGRPLAAFRPSFLDIWPSGSLYWQRPLPPSPFAPPLENLQHRTRHPLQTMVEMAIDDLIARRAGVPLCQLWGGAWRMSIPVDYWMGRVTPSHAQKCIQRAKSLGFHGVKLKTTLEDPNVERLEAVRDAGGKDWKVTVDPNGRFYRLDDALPTIRAMEQVGNMAILEDPFPRFHLPEFAELRRRISARVVVHIDPPESLWSVLTSGAAGGLNIDSHTQGLFNWRSQAAAAAQANLPVWHGSGLDLGVYTAAQLHACASAPNCTLPGDQIGPWLHESHLLQKDFTVEDGHVRVPMGIGSGVEVDLAAIDKYCVESRSWPQGSPSNQHR